MITALAEFDAERDTCFDENGNPNGAIFSTAVAMWSYCQPDDPTVNKAALAFNATPDVIKQAVNENHCLFLNGDIIEPEGY